MSFLEKKFNTTFSINARNTFLVTQSQNITYQESFERIHSLTLYLKSIGIKSHERIGILANPSIDLMLLLLALWQNKNIVCLLNTRLPEQSIKNQIQFLNIKSTFAEQIFSKTKDSSFIPIPSTEKLILSFQKNQDFNIREKQKATILFTSGSSGKPKAVLHSLANHLYSAEGSNAHIKLAKNDCWLLALPLFHVGGLSILFRTLLACSSIYLADKSEDSLTVCSRKKITHVSMVPTQLFRWLNQPNFSKPKNLKAILLGGAPMPSALLVKAIKKNLPIYVSYGLTEMASQVATSKTLKTTDHRLQTTKHRPQTKILKYREIKIAKNGEVLVKGKTRFLGYVQKDGLLKPFDKNGWFKTGDLGTFDKKNGLQILGRADNMFISGGENIHPEEIERHILAIAGVEQAIVIPVSDKEFGQRPALVAKMSKSLNLQKIQQKLSQHLPKYKIPVTLIPWSNKFLNSAGKVKRTK